jgi:hypothetical protein
MFCLVGLDKCISSCSPTASTLSQSPAIGTSNGTVQGDRHISSSQLIGQICLCPQFTRPYVDSHVLESQQELST